MIFRLRITVLIFAVFGTLAQSCLYYQRYRLPTERIQRLEQYPLNFYLVNPANTRSEVWYLSKVRFNGSEVTCQATRMSPFDAGEVTTISSRADAQWSKDDVLFYPDQALLATLPENGQISFDAKDLDKIEVYELNQSKTFGRPLVYLLGAVFFAFLLSTL